MKDITIEEIKNIPAPSIHKKNLKIMEELKTRMTNKKGTNALPCPHKLRQSEEKLRQQVVKQSKKHQNIVPVPTLPPFPTMQPTQTIHQPNHNTQQHTPTPVYLYSNRNVKLPFAPMGALPMPSLFHIFDVDGKKMNIDQLLKGKNGLLWNRGLDNELGRLSNGIPGRITRSNTITFINKNSVPKGEKVTYANLVCDFREHKEE